MNMPWPPIVAETTAPAAPAGTLSPDAALLVHGGATSVRLRASTSGAPSDARARTFPRLAAPTMALGSAAIPPPHRTRPRSKWDRKPFVRKAAVMSVGRSVPRVVACPPSPPPRGGRSGYRHSGGASSGAETGSRAEPGSGTAAHGEGDAEDGWVVGGGSGQESEGEADAAVARDVDKDAAVARDVDQDPGAAAGGCSAAAAAGALANQLSARGHNPRLFPAACWFPGAPAVLAAASVQHAGLPPIAPVIARGIHPAQLDRVASSRGYPSAAVCAQHAGGNAARC